MKRILVILVTISLFCINFFCKKTDNAAVDCTVYPMPAGAYNYPTKPGTTSWLNLGTTAARVQACQIPDSVLLNMSTAAVIQSWIDFPFNSDIIAASSFQSGIQFWLANFSGLIELQKRTDAELKLLERYKAINPSCISNLLSDTAKGNFSFSIIYTEMLIAQDTLLRNITIDVKRSLVTEATAKYNAKKKYSNDYDQLSLAASLFICAKVMKNTNYQPFINALSTSTVLTKYINSGNFPSGITDSNADIQRLIQLSSTFLN